MTSSEEEASSRSPAAVPLRDSRHGTASVELPKGPAAAANGDLRENDASKSAPEERGADAAVEDSLDGDEPPLDVILADESSGIASEQEMQRSSSGGSSIEEDAGTVKPLPSLNELVVQIPAEVRDALETLFRARFTQVTRVPRSVLEACAKAVPGRQ
ncbi:MAG: hypothetical protein KBA71_09395 [Opitutaceae bacterium]|nr:hypothetical protein [Opitutaceae bacterium]